MINTLKLTRFLILVLLYPGSVFSQDAWTSVGPGLNAQGLCMTEYKGSLYIGKLNFSVADEINRWDGQNLTGVGSGTNGPVAALLVENDLLYVGGGFSEAGGKTAANVATWNGTTWTAIGNQLDNFCINALAMYHGYLYAGGYSFTAFGTSSAFTVARWDGSQWVAAGDGLQGGDVYCLTVYNDELYASGSFTQSGTVSTPHIAKWNDTSWSAAGSGSTTGSTVYTLKEYRGELYAGGSFTSIGGINAGGIAKWNGSVWSAAGSAGDHPDNTVVTLAVTGNNLYVGGAFSKIGNDTMNHIAKWNGSTWSKLGGGIGTVNNPNEQVWNIITYKNDLFAAGTFSTADGKSAVNIARWTGTTGISRVSSLVNDVQIFPNPATSGEVTVGVHLKKDADISISIFDIQGRLVSVIYKGKAGAGKTVYNIDAVNSYAAGEYMVRIVCDRDIIVKPLLIP